MTTLDWIILVFVSVLAVYGYARGFLVGFLSLLGFAAGAFLGTRLVPLLLSEGSKSPYAPLFGLAGALLLGGLLASGLELLGFELRRRIRIPGFGVLDGLLGAALSACVAFGIAWLLGAVALQTPGAGQLRDDIQRSVVLQRLNQLLPPSGPILNALARVDPFPQINGPRADVPPPTGGILRDPDVRSASASVVRILGTACGLGVEGSGWVAGSGVVVTNAHVVAGEDDTVVHVHGDGPGLTARAIHFDPRNDIAILRVDGLDAPPLPLAGDAPPGTAAAILGYPQNGPYDARPARIGETQETLTDDAYGRGPVRRLITSLRGLVREGNSGGPVVDASGRVLTTVFAATVGGAQGGYGVPDTVVRSALADARGTVSTGPCAR
ncbi:MAG TPA: MarP family serine protease [Solirubrobacteraceae bacterium]|nr:MarP family serine protease [Solirubrobacteraceae bacterium]